MTRGKFLGLLGALPFVGSLVGKASAPPAKAGTWDPSMTELPSLEWIDKNLWLALDQAQAERGEVSSVTQTWVARPDRCHAWELATTVVFEGRPALCCRNLWDQEPDEDIRHQLKLDAIHQARRYWAKRDKWQRKAREALARGIAST
jgi:hypothetical protein